MITVLAIIAAVALGLNALGSVALWAIVTIKDRKEGPHDSSN